MTRSRSAGVSTDCERTQRIALHYGAEAPFLRPAEFATSTSPDIEWLRHCFETLEESYEAFAILRPTSPFRTVESLVRYIQTSIGAAP